MSGYKLEVIPAPGCRSRAFWRGIGDFTGHLDTSWIEERGIGGRVCIERVEGAQRFEFSSFLIDDCPGAEVNGEGEGDDEPGGAVEDCDAEHVPWHGDPAP